MRILNMREPILLLLFDVFTLCFSLWLTLVVRHFEMPSWELIQIHIVPFTVVFIMWIIVFYIAGLYEKHTSILKSKLPVIILHAHIWASVIALALFYFLVPVFALTPKTVLIIFVAISFGLFYVMRVFLYARISLVKKENAILIGSGKEVEELFHEVNSNKYYPLYFVEMLNQDMYSVDEFKQKCTDLIESKNIEIIVGDLKHKRDESVNSFFYELIFREIYFVDICQMYENVFQKVPLSLIDYDWFVKHISKSNKMIYDTLKRIVDFVIALIGLIVSSVIFFFVFFAIKIEEPFGTIFISQKRVGKNRTDITIHKFRSMKNNENGVWIGESENIITKVGKFLRKSSIDEFPQFLNILKGDISLVGPRPDMTGLADRLVKEIPYYATRYTVSPGLSGWAQTQQSIIPNSIEENKERLAYDLFYIKNRSVLLDIKIILKTIKTLLVRGAK